ncbi:MAG: hypothetical protein H6577_27010 [Lewinellaceae bacterium]|nr:hypothetical protein [Saprospiraceae bacterium]MCB9341793.1 hypothetical protein [Lewinellaceae bacterium]
MESINYRIIDIQELELFIPMVLAEIADDFEEEKLGYGFTFDYSWNLKSDTFSVIVEVLYVYDQEKMNEILLKFLGLVEYEIQDLKQFLDLTNNEVKLPEEFLAILTGIAISTMRGMIALRTVGKFQGDFYIPILNPGDVVRDYLNSEKRTPNIAEEN